MKYIPLHGKYGEGKFFLVDDEDYEQVRKHSWCLSKHGNWFYPETGSWNPLTKTRKVITIQAFLLIITKGLRRDHRNGNTLDNTRNNLRVCTNQQNIFNSRKTNKPTSSTYKGVSWNKALGQWQAYIRFNKRMRHLGFFDKEEAAAESYNTAARQYFGNFASLNKLKEKA